MPAMARLRIGAVTAFLCAIATIAAADQWNDKTTLKFDEPVMVPGTTLPPGTYTFKLLDSRANRNIVEIFNEDETKLITTAMAIPARRTDANGDVVVKFNPTEAGAPIALQTWYYPGSLYGHQFIYSDEQARQIAKRTKTLVLSGDVTGSDMESGTLYTYDAEGRQAPWKADEQTMAEWRKWNDEGRRAAAQAKVVAPGTEETRKSTAPMMRNEPQGTKVSISDLEENPARYTGQTITVTGEVEDVFGPRVFKIDEKGWADLDREILVYLPTDLVALVRDDDLVTVTGTMKMLTKADIDRELAWLEPGADAATTLTRRPALVAREVVGGTSNVALAIRVNPDAAGGTSAGTSASTDTSGTSGTTGTSGTAGSAGAATSPSTGGSASAGASTSGAVTDLSTLAKGDRELVGRHVDLTGVTISRVAKGQGFWIEGGGGSVFVLPAQASATPAAGKSVSVKGVVLQMPRSMRDKSRSAGSGNDEIYISASAVR